MSRTPLLAGNWKMHGDRAEAAALARAVVAAAARATGREVLVAPPFTALGVVAEIVAGSAVRLAAQDVHWEAKGAFTGEVSVGMLRDAGCTHVIIGHSERRQLFGETNETVHRRLRAALAGGLVPIVCVGETLEEREAGATAAVVERQIAVAFGGLRPRQVGECIVAYEPVWAIGTGRTATPAQAEAVHRAIRDQLADLANRATADRIRILYGGSVKADNVDALMAEPDLDGALVGGASLDATAFTRIIHFQGK